MTVAENIASIALDMALTGDRYNEVYERGTEATGMGAHDFFVMGVAQAGTRVAEWEAATGKDFDLLEQSGQIADALLHAWNNCDGDYDLDGSNPNNPNDVNGIVDTMLDQEWPEYVSSMRGDL